MDDRDESAGVKFNDSELLGIPYSIVIGEKGLKKGILELKDRQTGSISESKTEDIERHIFTLLDPTC